MIIVVEILNPYSLILNISFQSILVTGYPLNKIEGVEIQ